MSGGRQTKYQGAVPKCAGRRELANRTHSSLKCASVTDVTGCSDGPLRSACFETRVRADHCVVKFSRSISQSRHADSPGVALDLQAPNTHPRKGRKPCASGPTARAFRTGVARRVRADSRAVHRNSQGRGPARGPSPLERRGRATAISARPESRESQQIYCSPRSRTTDPSSLPRAPRGEVARVRTMMPRCRAVAILSADDRRDGRSSASRAHARCRRAVCARARRALRKSRARRSWCRQRL